MARIMVVHKWPVTLHQDKIVTAIAEELDEIYQDHTEIFWCRDDNDNYIRGYQVEYLIILGDISLNARHAAIPCVVGGSILEF